MKEITEEKKLRIDTPRHGPAVKQHQNNSQKKITAAISVNEYDEKRTMPIKEGVVAARRPTNLFTNACAEPQRGG